MNLLRATLSSFARGDLKAFCLLTLVWWSCVLAIGPWGDFPLNDDWAYAWTVQGLLEGRGLRISDSAGPTLVFQALWGALFCLPFGFGFDSLRFSTLVLGWVGGLSLFGLLRAVRADAGTAAAGALVLMLNPFYLVLAHTFMTDVPALAMSLGAVFLYVRGAEDDRWLLPASLAAAAAYLIRQPAVFLPLAGILVLRAKGRLTPRRAALAVGAPAAALLLHRAWFLHVHGPTLAHRLHLVQGVAAFLTDPARSLPEILRRLAAAPLYLGAFVSPFAAASLAKHPWGWLAAVRTSRGLWVGAPAVLAAAFLWAGPSPILGNILGPHGLGACTLGPSCAVKASGVFRTRAFWLLAGGAAAGSALGTLGLASAWRRDRVLESAGLPFVLGLLACLASPFFYDRYLLWLLPPAILAWTAVLVRDRGSALAGAVLLWILGLVSLAGTADYLAWGRARWRAGDLLVGRGIPPRHISNGFEWDGVHTFERNLRVLLASKPPEAIGPGEWHLLNRYGAAVSFSDRPPKEGFVPWGEVPYVTPLKAGGAALTLWRFVGPLPPAGTDPAARRARGAGGAEPRI